MQTEKFKVDFDRCKGCSLCTTACPKKIIVMQNEKLNKEGFITAVCTDRSACTACALCAIMCPDCAIEICTA
ncbi:MAG: 4Fe-4S binding protein [Oscillospiraceae bacterium]|nr:4Fe-4S binding protein [Oscillospiraceae bacterium]